MPAKKSAEDKYQEQMDKLSEKLEKLEPRIEKAAKKAEEFKEKAKEADKALTDLENEKLKLQNEMLILYMTTHHNSSDVAYYDSFLETIKTQFETGQPAKNFIKDDE